MKILAPLTLSLALPLAVGCTGSSGGATPDAGEWPKVVELVHQPDDDSQAGVRLSDGALTTQDGGDFGLYPGESLSKSSLRARARSFCRKGKFESLSEIPSNTDICPQEAHGSEGPWTEWLDLSSALDHTFEESGVIGTSTLFVGYPDAPLYRLRVLGDSFQDGTAIVRIEYEPVHSEPSP